MLEQSVSIVVEYLHVAFSSVESSSVVLVTPDSSVLFGDPLESIGGVVSVTLELLDDELILEELLETLELDSRMLDADELELLEIIDELLELLCIVIVLDELLDVELELDDKMLDSDEFKLEPLDEELGTRADELLELDRADELKLEDEELLDVVFESVES